MHSTQPIDTELLVIGAGPYGLATAAAARAAGIDPLVVGEPMEFWRTSMPAGMLLRSSIDWQLDPLGEHTLAAFLRERGVQAAAADPIPLELFVAYAEWFRAAKDIAVQPLRVRDLRRLGGGRLEALLHDGRRVRAGAIVATPGVEPFAQLPDWVERRLPPRRYTHTSRLPRPERLAGSHVLIVGGRQSAYETAALLAESGTERVHVVHRHPAPRFAPADWSFVEPMIDSTVRWPGWFRALPLLRREAIERRFWAEGRLKLEPWLGHRVARPDITRRPRTAVNGARETAVGTVAVTLSGGESLTVDHVVLATGYRADLTRIPYLAGVLDRIELAGGFPVLDRSFQTTVPDLYVTGFAATRDFGPIFGFVRGATAAATIIARALTRPDKEENQWLAA
jgi:cation diffusion facilitator CzcD-associated flavoprotein CzcO